jgi:hypothetical protein
MRATNLRTAIAVGLLLSFVVVLTECAHALAADANEQSTVEWFDLPQTPWPGGGELGIDASGAPWVMANNRLFWFDGGKFVEPKSPTLSSGQYLTQLVGGPDRGLYASQPGEVDHEGKLYRLDRGAAELVTTFYYDDAGDLPSLYVSRDGRLFNWGQRFIAAYKGKVWDRIEASLGNPRALRGPAIVDLGDDIYFYSGDENAIYRVDANGALTRRDGPPWLREAQRQQGTGEAPTKHGLTAAWKDKVLVANLEGSQLLAFDIVSGERVELPSVPDIGHKISWCDAFTTADGGAWLLAALDGWRAFAFFQVDDEGRAVEVKGARGLPWQNTRLWQFPQAIVRTRDGAVVLGLENDGLGVIQRDALTRWNWRHGFAESVPEIVEGKEGELWLAPRNRGRAVARVRVRPLPPPELPVSEDWEEFALVSGSQAWSLPGGEIAVLRRDKPKQLCRWRNGSWSFQDLPFDATRLVHSAADDRGHILLAVNDQELKAHDVGPDSVTTYPSVDDALAAAHKAGARHFSDITSFVGIVATDKELWYAFHTECRRFDGIRWDSFRSRNSVTALARSEELGVLIGFQEGSFSHYDRGQLVPTASRKQMNRMLLGPDGFQPFDAALARRYPDAYIPVVGRPGDDLRLAFDVEAVARGEALPAERNASQPMMEARGKSRLQLPRYVERLQADSGGGAWIFSSQGAGAPQRVFANELLPIEFESSPLAARYITNVARSDDGDQWFTTRTDAGYSVLRRRISQAQIEASAPADFSVGRELKAPYKIQPARFGAATSVYWRVNEGPYQRAASDDGVLMRFPASGEYRCEVVGLNLGSVVEGSAPVIFQAMVASPDTRLAGAAVPTTIDEFTWAPPAEAVPSSADVETRIVWRVNDRSWQPLDEEGAITMDGLASGRHTIELAAEEAGFWRDPTPLSLVVDYQPDWQKIVDRHLRELASENSDVRRRATERLLRLGDEGKAVWMQRLRQARESAALLRQMETLNSQMQMLGGDQLER